MLSANNIVALRCEGSVEGNRFLDGRTLEGSAALAPNTDVPPFTGTWWRTHDAGGGELFLETLGHLGGNRFLDGRTQDSTIGLAPNVNPPFTGTKWRPIDAGVDLVRLECLGTIPGNRFLDGRTGDGSVGLAPHTGAPFSGTLWRVVAALSNFTFADDISVENRNRLIDRHRFALASVIACGNLSEGEKERLYQAYRRPIHHTTLNRPRTNASAIVGGSTVNVNFGLLFPQGDEEISQTLIHEMMHCAGLDHPRDRRFPPAGQSCNAPDPAFDCPNDNGPYYGTAPLRAEFCIAGDQSDVRGRLMRKAADEHCTIDADGVATIHATSERNR
jgi:hypothetical protein